MIAVAQLSTAPLAAALRPFQELLNDPTVSEISVNGPGSVFVERSGDAYMSPVDLCGVDARSIKHLAERIAASTDQSINEATPILSARLPTGERFQAVLAPAAPAGGAFSIRKQVTRQMSLDDYEMSGGFSQITVTNGTELSDVERELKAHLEAGRTKQFLIQAIHSKVSILVSGGTSSGKTTLLNALLGQVPSNERIITIEDTQELLPPQQNVLSLVASKNNQGLAKVDTQSLLEASLRLRPDRILIGELRGKEALSFLNAINTGHPGSLSTVHANSPSSAYDRLALMVMENGVNLGKSEIIQFLKDAIPIVVQVNRVSGQRAVSEIFYSRL